MRTLIFDTETTDLVKNELMPLEKQPHVIEAFALSFIDGVEKEAFHYLFNPGFKISETITKITGITNDILVGQHMFADRAALLAGLISSHDEVVAHNLAFDKAMMNIEFRRCGMTVNWPEGICTVEATEYMKGHRLNLAGLHETLFGEEFDGAHRAENDVRALARCFWKLREMEIV